MIFREPAGGMIICGMMAFQQLVADDLTQLKTG